MTAIDTIRLLAALAVICAAAHGCGFLFGALRQPPVIGEVVGGILLGPSLLGLVAPGARSALFPASGAVTSALEATYQLGQLLLMFLAGAELRIRAGGRERRTGAIVAVAGLVVPFAAGAALAARVPGVFAGPRGSTVTTALVVGLAMAVAAIPVISRIMMDLGITDTAFGRIVLMVAVIEDVILYVVLAVVLGLARSGTGHSAGLWDVIGTTAVAPTVVYFTAVSLLFFSASLTWGARLFSRLAGHRANIVARQSPVAFRLIFLCVMVLLCLGLGINAVFGALMAGICAVRGDQAAAEDGPAAEDKPAVWAAIRQFSTAFFIPVFFVLVGMRLDLVRALDPLFFLWFLTLACGIKTISIWAAARLAGEDPLFSSSLAFALNARGTIGIVLAGVTRQADLINDRFFVVLVLVSLVTCQIAGHRLAKAADRLMTATVTGARPRLRGTGAGR
ncbi:MULTISPECIES: cation:proton antiporter [unclassified Streptomyces]|uniref:cation:proton antiporter n=1 Tax=unclassified Streptomyces TaxID=2593676 RepID=UPI002E1222FE|nr:cation:proton antiporter [Streptomyces sp. NBC_01207]WTA23054.1 cation:proton antiporter [Streptomyces sp. NBC_00853]